MCIAWPLATDLMEGGTQAGYCMGGGRLLSITW